MFLLTVTSRSSPWHEKKSCRDVPQPAKKWCTENPWGLQNRSDTFPIFSRQGKDSDLESLKTQPGFMGSNSALKAKPVLPY